MITSKFRRDPVCAEPKIFVGQIPFEATEDQVIQLFSKYGNIDKCSVISGQDGRPKGCAMVTFQRWAEAELAVENENGTSNLGGTKPLTVKFADPPKRGDGPLVGVAPKKLFVGQIPSNVTEEILRRYFETHGVVNDVHILTKPGTQLVACAFITYDRWSQAEEAIEALNGNVTIPGAAKPLNVRFADAKMTRTPKTSTGQLGGGGGVAAEAVAGGLKRSAFVSGVDSSVYGNPNKRAVSERPGHNAGGVSPLAGTPYNPYPLAYLDTVANLTNLCYGVPGMPAGMPFANMMNMGLGSLGVAGLQGLAGTNAPGVAAAAQMMQGGMMGGVGPKGFQGSGSGSGSIGDGPKSWKLFVGQVPFEASEEDLRPVFSQVGVVLELAVLRQNGRSRGCAFVTYETRAIAEKAIAVLNNKAVLPKDPHQRLLRVKFANNNLGAGNNSNGVPAMSLGIAAGLNGGVGSNGSGAY